MPSPLKSVKVIVEPFWVLILILQAVTIFQLSLLMVNFFHSFITASANVDVCKFVYPTRANRIIFSAFLTEDITPKSRIQNYQPSFKTIFSKVSLSKPHTSKANFVSSRDNLHISGRLLGTARPIIEASSIFLRISLSKRIFSLKLFASLISPSPKLNEHNKPNS